MHKTKPCIARPAVFVEQIHTPLGTLETVVADGMVVDVQAHLSNGVPKQYFMSHQEFAAAWCETGEQVATSNDQQAHMQYRPKTDEKIIWKPADDSGVIKTLLSTGFRTAANLRCLVQAGSALALACRESSGDSPPTWTVRTGIVVDG